jgi:hypothetical protein
MRGEYRFKIADSVGFSVGAGNDPTVLNGLLIDIPSRLAQRISG